MSKIKAPGKWMKDVTADTPATDAAERFLRCRLTGVCEFLPLASRRYHKDPEYVHQLRVATRRSDAALLAFHRCIKKKRLKKMRKHLKRIRRAAGEARTCDVHASIFAQCLDRAGDAQRPILEYVLTRTLDERAAAQVEIDAVADQYRGSRLRRRCRKLLGSIRPPKDHADGADGEDTEHVDDASPLTLCDIARTSLPDLVTRLERVASGSLTEIATLHQLRIAGKRLRYAMEIFAPCFDRSFRDELYPRVEAMQSRLGRINDTDEVLARLDRYASALGGRAGDKSGRTSKGGSGRGSGQTNASRRDLRRGLDELLQVFRTQLDRDHEAFLNWWTEFNPASLLDALHSHTETSRFGTAAAYDDADGGPASRDVEPDDSTNGSTQSSSEHGKKVHA